MQYAEDGFENIMTKKERNFFGDVPTIILVWPPIFVNTKEFSKKYKGKFAAGQFMLPFVTGGSY
jgi:hypothetical protein